MSKRQAIIAAVKSGAWTSIVQTVLGIGVTVSILIAVPGSRQRLSLSSESGRAPVELGRLAPDQLGLFLPASHWSRGIGWLPVRSHISRYWS